MLWWIFFCAQVSREASCIRDHLDRQRCNRPISLVPFRSAPFSLWLWLCFWGVTSRSSSFFLPADGGSGAGAATATMSISSPTSATSELCRSRERAWAKSPLLASVWGKQLKVYRFHFDNPSVTASQNLWEVLEQQKRGSVMSGAVSDKRAGSASGMAGYERSCLCFFFRNHGKRFCLASVLARA